MPIREVLTDHKTISVAHPASTEVTIGSLLWNNAGVAALASAQADALSLTANQHLFAQRFLGVAGDQRLSTETSTGNSSRRLVIADGIFDLPCASTTWAIGDLIGPVENSGGDALEDQKVAKVTNPELAIGYCIAPATSSTTVRGRLISKYLPGMVRKGYTGSHTERMTQTAVTDTATITAAQLLTKVLDGTPTAAATYTLPTAALLVAAMPGVAVGDSFTFLVNNKSGGANTITLDAGSGGTKDGTMTVAQNVIRAFTIIITNVTASSEAYFLYGQG